MKVIEGEEKYLGHVSVSVYRDVLGNFYGNDVKYGQTAAAGSAIFSEIMQQANPSASESFSLTQLHTQRTIKYNEMYNIESLNHFLSLLYTNI